MWKCIITVPGSSVEWKMMKAGERLSNFGVINTKNMLPEPMKADGIKSVGKII